MDYSVEPSNITLVYCCHLASVALPRRRRVTIEKLNRTIVSFENALSRPAFIMESPNPPKLPQNHYTDLQLDSSLARKTTQITQTHVSLTRNAVGPKRFSGYPSFRLCHGSQQSRQLPPLVIVGFGPSHHTSALVHDYVSFHAKLCSRTTSTMKSFASREASRLFSRSSLVHRPSITGSRRHPNIRTQEQTRGFRETRGLLAVKPYLLADIGEG